jgi:hypothetical protein
MVYLVWKEDLEKLMKGEIKVEDLTTSERIILISWTGEDIKNMLKDIKTDKSLEDIIYEVKSALDSCDCADCIECALDAVLENEKDKNTE